MFGLIISFIVFGLIAGALARLLVPGRQHMSIPMTVLLGISGSFVGGFLAYCSSTSTRRTALSNHPASSVRLSARSSSCSFGCASGTASTSAGEQCPSSRGTSAWTQMNLGSVIAVLYAIFRVPMSVVDNRIARRVSAHSRPRRLFDLCLGTIDRSAGNLLLEERISRSGQARIDRAHASTRPTTPSRAIETPNKSEKLDARTRPANAYPRR